MFCTNCGAEIAVNAKFCVKCGARVEGNTDRDSVNPALSPQTPVYQQPVQPNVPPQPQYAVYSAVAPAVGQKKSAWQYFCSAWRKYAVFKGRARRAEFWWFTVFNSIISLVLGFIEGFAIDEMDISFYIAENVGLLTLIYGLVVFLPSWGVMVRRFHDVDRRAWWCLVPIYGWIVVLCTAGTVGPNRFGSDPKQTD